jgi:tripartite ATP-independent transporter DctM subunit
MIRQGYPPAFAGAVVAAGGSLGVIIPPSIPMVIFGFLTNVSIAKLFMGGVIVGVFFGLVLMLIAAGISWQKGYGNRRSFSLIRVGQSFRGAFWALWAPVIVLGGILTGIVTVTEAAALAVFYALFVSLVINRELKWADLPSQILRSQITAATILLIIAMSKVFTWLVAMKQTSQLLGAVMMNLGLPPVSLLLLTMVGLLVVGCVMETTAALILLVPVLIALTPQLGVDPTQFGVLIVTNLAIGMLTPPIGICLFVSCGISGATLSQTARSVLPFVLAAFFVLLLTSLWPPLTLWLPSVVYP